MERYFLYGGIALALFSLWALARVDVQRLGTLTREVSAEVTSHRISRDGDGITYAPIYRFEAEGATHEVVDQVYTTGQRPAIGTRVSLTYPVGKPELARPPRPLLRAAIYAALLFMLGVLVAKATGRLS